MTPRIYIALIILFISTQLLGQPGIYTEGDIELQAIFIEAQLEKQKGDKDKQIELLKEVIKRERSADAAYYELAKAYLSKDEFELAERNAKRANDLDPSNIWYLILLTDIYEHEHKYDNAIEICTQLILLEESEDKHVIRLSFNQLKSGRPDDAINSLLALQAKRGIQEDISKKIFEIQHNSNRIDDAAQTLRILCNEYPYNDRFLNNLAGYLYDNGRKEEAVIEYRKLIELNPDNAEAALVLAKEDPVEGDNKLMSIESLASNPNIPLDNIIHELMPYMVSMESESEQTPILDRISLKLLDRFPREAKTHSIRADILFYTGRYKESEKMYEKAISFDDSRYTLWDQWIINLWELENYAKMRTISLDAIDLFPNQVNPLIYYTMASKKLDQPEIAHDYLMEAKFIAGNNQKYTAAINTVEIWLNSALKTSDEIRHELSLIDEELLYSPLFFELMAELYGMILDSPKSRDLWNKAVDMGAGKDRIRKKMASIN